jgi:hypothetical protein
MDATRRLLEPEHSYLHVLLKTRKFYGKLRYFWTPKQSLTAFKVRCVYLAPLRIFPTTAWSLKAGSIASRSVNAILSICFCHKLLGAPFLLAWDPEPEVSVIDSCPAKWSVSLKPQGVWGRKLDKVNDSLKKNKECSSRLFEEWIWRSMPGLCCLSCSKF